MIEKLSEIDMVLLYDPISGEISHEGLNNITDKINEIIDAVNEKQRIFLPTSIDTMLDAKTIESLKRIADSLEEIKPYFKERTISND